ncbi:hypothetical protein L596_024574 [Steinernema carpocapsae]|uniref:Uncharacterized protein n=1 Tax=Steinernema carpocapsae TaxID=34508 RepID=A0A4U5MH60_STECR|nr:hypothetical protein L596_024574 [Steinernema carpocapsae]
MTIFSAIRSSLAVISMSAARREQRPYGNLSPWHGSVDVFCVGEERALVNLLTLINRSLRLATSAALAHQRQSQEFEVTSAS